MLLQNQHFGYKCSRHSLKNASISQRHFKSAYVTSLIYAFSVTSNRIYLIYHNMQPLLWLRMPSVYSFSQPIGVYIDIILYCVALASKRNITFCNCFQTPFVTYSSQFHLVVKALGTRRRKLGF